MRFIVVFLSFLCFGFPVSAEVYIADEIGMVVPQETVVVDPGNILAVPIIQINRVEAHHKFSFQTEASIFTEFDVLICENVEKRIVMSGGRGRCIRKRFDGRGFAEFTVPPGEKWWLLFDNGSALLNSRIVTFSGHVSFEHIPEAMELFEVALNALLTDIQHYFEVDEFDLNLVSCGSPNAFSMIEGGHLYLCTELFFDTIQKEIPYALSGILAHEMGHTLPNLWGSPHFANEKAADEFAVAFLFITQNFETLSDIESDDDVTPQQVIRELIRYFEGLSDISNETRAALLGDQHPLSIQRINSLKSILRSPKPFIQRWNKEIYPHLKIPALQSIIDEPHVGADLQLAKSLLKKRQACGSVSLDKCQIITE